MKILLIGKNGQVGWELDRCLRTLGQVQAIDYPEIDLVRADSIREWIHRIQPQVIVNAAAYTAVDRAESEPELAMAINGAAPGILAEEALKIGSALVHYSTDYVFDGTKVEAYQETDAPNPLSVYGWSKLAGDQNIQQVGGATLIMRTSWVYSLRQGGFVGKVLSWARQNETLRIVSDQVGSPTWARMLAQATTQLLAKAGADPHAWIDERRGLYHLGGAGAVSRLDWAKAILNYDPNPGEQVVREVLPALTRDFPTPAQRPLFSPVKCDLFENTFGLTLPGWEVALSLAMGQDIVKVA
jgi:dTDP-4-dehydrorhamnose reductase